MGRVDLHQSTIDAATAAAGQRWGHRIGRRVTNAAKAHCPVDEGRLRASIDYTVDTSTSGRTVVTVGSPLDYAEYFHTGTGIHGPKGTPIVPVSRKALKFRYAGPGGSAAVAKERRGWVFAKSVKGIEPNPFLIDGLRDVLGYLAHRRRTR